MADIIQLATAPVNGSSEQQTLTGNSGGTITSGRFKLGYKGDVTGWLQYTATATQIRDALRLLNEITATGIASASGGPLPGTPVVALYGGHLANRNVAQLTLAANELVGGTIAITTNVAGVNGTIGYDKGTVVVARDTGVVYVNTGTRDVPVWGRVLSGAQAAAITDLTMTVGTADGTLEDVTASPTQAAINNNFREVGTKINAILAALRGQGGVGS